MNNSYNDILIRIKNLESEYLHVFGAASTKYLFKVNKLVKKEKDYSTCSILDFSFIVFLAWFDAWCVLICLVLYYICLAPAEWSYVILGCPGYCFSAMLLAFS